MNDSDYSDFTKLMLARMESNPEEFASNNRWDNLVRGLEEYARGDTEGRYVKTLWPLEHQEIEVMLAKYRRVYLDRLHKEMLKNIVSGNDKRDTLGTSLPSGVVRGPLTAKDVTNQSLQLLNQSFDKEYASGFTDTHALFNAVVKQEGAQIAPAPKVSRYLLTPAQVAIAQKMGMDPADYAKHVDRFQG